jgi:hypothetical protein
MCAGYGVVWVVKRMLLSLVLSDLEEYEHSVLRITDLYED